MTDTETGEAALPGPAGRDMPLNGGRDRVPLRFLFLAKGFSRIFWGLLVAMLLFFGNAAVEVFNFVKLPAYVAGCFLAAWGLWILPAAGAVGPKWPRRVRIALALVLLQIYFAPFLEWWKLAPALTFYLLNVMGLLLVSMLALFFVNLLAADTFRRLRDRGSEVEALSFAWGVILLTMAPLVLLMTMSLLAAVRHQSSFEYEMWQVILRLPIWAYMILTIPCSLTLTAAWKAKTLCYQRLAQGDEEAGEER